MPHNIPYIQYPIGTGWSDWVPADIIIDETTGVISAVTVTRPDGSTEAIDLPNPAKIRCAETSADTETPNNIYWAIINDNLLYRAEYNPRFNEAVKATPVQQPDKSKAVRRQELVGDTAGYDEAEYNDMAQSFALSQRPTDELLTLAEVNELTIREADAATTRTLIGEDDTELADAFVKRELEAYSNKMAVQLTELLTAHTESDYPTLHAALKDFLANHWKIVKGSNLAYTAIPNHPATKMLVRIAERLAETDDEPAISLLMPGVRIEPGEDVQDFPDLAAQFPPLSDFPLAQVLSTHILDASQQYFLLPITLTLAETQTDEAPKHLLKQGPVLTNPYYASDDQGRGTLAQTDVEHLYQHSPLTRHLHDAYIHYLEAAKDSPNLLSQLSTLCRMLRAYDAHGGMGKQTDADAGAYTAIPRFMAFYTQLNPIGLLKATSTPTMANLPSDRKVSYVIAPDGLYCLNQHDNTVTLICDNERKLRYPIDLLHVETLDEATLRESLPTTHPTLLKVDSPEEKYVLYGKSQDSAAWTFTDITMPQNAKVHFHEETDHPITLALGNVPEALYQEIEKKHAHRVETTVMAHLRETYPDDTPTCSLEQLHDIQTHTAHPYLLEFKQVPENIRTEISLLWDLIQNPAKNISATENIATCIGNRREAIEPLISKHAEDLERITWGDETIQTQYQEALTDLETTRNALRTALTTQAYTGRDTLPITPAVLAYLELPFELATEHDIERLFTFPPETIDALLNDPNNPDAKAFLKEYCKDRIDNIISLITNIPARSIKSLFEAIEPELRELIHQPSDRAVLCQTLVPEKCAAVYAYFGLLTDKNLQPIINPTDFTELAKRLDVEQLAPICHEIMQIGHFGLQRGRLLGKALHELSSENWPILFNIVTISNMRTAEYGAIMDCLSRDQLRIFITHQQTALNARLKSSRGLLPLFFPISDWTRIRTILTSMQPYWPGLIPTVEDAIASVIQAKNAPEALRLFTNQQQLTAILNALQNTPRHPNVLSYAISFCQEGDVHTKRHVPLLIESCAGCQAFHAPETVIHFINSLPIELVDTYLRAIQDNLSDIFTPITLYTDAQQQITDPKKRKLFFQSMLPYVPNLIGSTTLNVIHYINSFPTEQVDTYLRATQDNLSDIFTSMVLYTDALQLIADPQKRKLFCQSMHPYVPQLIDSTTLYVDTISHLAREEKKSRYTQTRYAQLLDRNYKTLFRKAVHDQAPKLVRSLAEYACTVQKLAMEKDRRSFCRAMSTRLAALITTEEELSEAFIYCNTDAKTHLLRKLDTTIPMLIDTFDKLCKILPLLSNADAILMRQLRNNLSKIIQTPEQLTHLLTSLVSDTAKKIVLQTIKGRLLVWNLASIAPQHSTLVAEARQSAQSLIKMFRYRADPILVGSTTQQLENYIKLRQQEWSFHWNVLCIKSLCYWLSGDRYFVKSRDTKCDAATFLLQVLRGERSPKINIHFSEALPDAETLQQTDYTNSYIWGNSTLHYVNHKGQVSTVSVKNTNELALLLEAKKPEDNRESCARISFSLHELNSLLSEQVKKILPTVSLTKALAEGMLGHIVESEDRRLPEILSNAQKKWDINHPPPAEEEAPEAPTAK